MKGSPAGQDLRALHRVLPGAAHVPEAVVTIGIERIEGERHPPRAGLREPPRQVLGDAHAVGADDDPKAALRARRTISRMSRRRSGSPPVRMVRHSGAKAAISSMTLKHSSVPSSLRSAKFSVADGGLAAGVEIAVLAGQVAAVGEVPGDDVGPGEPGRVRIWFPVSGPVTASFTGGQEVRRPGGFFFSKKTSCSYLVQSFAVNVSHTRRRCGPRPGWPRLPRAALLASQLLDPAVPWGARTRGCSASGFRGGSPADWDRVAGRLFPRSPGTIAENGHASGGPTPPWGPIFTPSDCTTVFFRVGRHGDFIVAGGARVDDGERTTWGGPWSGASSAVAGDTQELHREVLRELLRDMARALPTGVPEGLREEHPDRSAPPGRDRKGGARGKGSPSADFAGTGR